MGSALGEYSKDKYEIKLPDFEEEIKE